MAVKTPRAEALAAAGGLENFVREAETWVDLGLHPHVVSCFFVRDIAGATRIFAEYLAGGSLKQWIAERRCTELGDILDVAIQFAWGLEYAHAQGLTHQDIKPANVMMSPDGVAKITDFGLARAKPAPSGHTEQPAGSESVMVTAGGYTPAYAAPEQLSGERITRKADIWAFAASVLEMFCGQVTWLVGTAAGEALEQYLAAGPPQDMPAMPDSVAQLLRRCFAYDSRERPDDMGQVADGLVAAWRETTGQEYPRSRPKAGAGTADSLNNKALSLIELGRLEAAEQTLFKALEVDMHHVEASYNLGLYAWMYKQVTPGEAIHRMEAVSQSHPDSRVDELHLGRLHLLFDNYDRAEELFRQAMEDTGHGADGAGRDLGLALLGKCAETSRTARPDGDVTGTVQRMAAEARPLLESALAEAPGDVQVMAALSQALDYEDPDGLPGAAAYAGFARERASTLPGYAEAVRRYVPGRDILAERVMPVASGLLLPSRDNSWAMLLETERFTRYGLSALDAGDLRHELPEGCRALSGVLSPDDQTLYVCGLVNRSESAGGGWDCLLMAWDVTGQSFRYVQTVHDNSLDFLRVSPAGDKLVGASYPAGSEEGALFVWDAATGKELSRAAYSGKRCHDALFLPGGERVAAILYTEGTADGGELVIIDSATGQPVRTLPPHADTRSIFWTSMQVSADGSHVLAVADGSGGQIGCCLWSLDKGEAVLAGQDTVAILHPLTGHLLFWHPEQDATVRELTLDGLKERASFTAKPDARWMGYADSGNTAWIWQRQETPEGGDDAISLYDLTAPHAPCIKTSHWRKGDPPVSRVEARPDGALLLSSDQAVRILAGRVATVPEFALVRPQTAELHAEKERRFAALLEEAQARFDQGAMGNALELVRSARDIDGYARDPRGQDLWMHLGFCYPHVGVRNLYRINAFAAHQHAGNLAQASMAVDEAGGKLAVGGNFLDVLVWDPVDANQVLTLNDGRQLNLTHVTFAGSGRYILAASHRHVSVFDAGNGSLLRTLEVDGTIAALAARPGPYGTEAYLGMEDGAVRVVDLETMDFGRPIEETAPGIRTLKVSPLGDMLLVVSGATLTIVDLVNGKVRARYTPPPVRSVFFSPLGDPYLLLEREGKNLVRWNLGRGSAKPLASAPAAPPYDMHDPRSIAMYESSVSGDGRYALLGGQGGVALVDLVTGEILRRITLIEGRQVCFTSFLSANKYAVAAVREGSVYLLQIDWDLGQRDICAWDDDVRPFLTAFLARRRAAGRTGLVPRAEFDMLMHQLIQAGAGYVQAYGIRDELEKMAGVPVEGPRLEEELVLENELELEGNSNAESNGEMVDIDVLQGQLQEGFQEAMIDAGLLFQGAHEAGAIAAQSIYCPKCHGKSEPGEACSRCGFSFSNYDVVAAIRKLHDEAMRLAGRQINFSPLAGRAGMQRDAQYFGLLKALGEALGSTADNIAEDTDMRFRMNYGLNLMHNVQLVPFLTNISPPGVDGITSKALHIARYLLSNQYTRSMMHVLAKMMLDNAEILQTVFRAPQKNFPRNWQKDRVGMTLLTRGPKLVQEWAALLRNTQPDDGGACVKLGQQLWVVSSQLAGQPFRGLYQMVYPNHVENVLIAVLSLQDVARVLTRFSVKKHVAFKDVEALVMARQQAPAEDNRKAPEPAAKPVVQKKAPPIKKSYDSLEDIVAAYKTRSLHERIHLMPNIPHYKLAEAKRKHIPLREDETVLALLDTSTIGNGKVGMLLTDRAIRFKDSFNKPTMVKLAKVESLDLNKGVLADTLLVNDEQQLTLAKGQESNGRLMEMLQHVVDFVQQREPAHKPGKEAPAEEPSAMATRMAASLSFYRTAKQSQNLHIIPDIPEDALALMLQQLAFVTIAPGRDETPVILAVNRNGSRGLLVTESKIYHLGEPPAVMDILSVHSAEYKQDLFGGALFLNTKRFPTQFTLDRKDVPLFCNMLYDVLQTAQQGEGSQGPPPDWDSEAD